MAPAPANTAPSVSNANSGPATYEDVGLGITGDGQPWIGDYERPPNSKMRDFQAGIMRPFDGIEEPRRLGPNTRSSAYRCRVLILRLAAAAVMLGLGSLVLCYLIRVDTEPSTKPECDLFGPRPYSGTTYCTWPTHTQGAAVAVVITQDPVPTTIASAATTEQTIHPPSSGFLFPDRKSVV